MVYFNCFSLAKNILVTLSYGINQHKFIQIQIFIQRQNGVSKLNFWRIFRSVKCFGEFSFEFSCQSSHQMACTQASQLYFKCSFYSIKTWNEVNFCLINWSSTRLTRSVQRPEFFFCPADSIRFPHSATVVECPSPWSGSL